MSAVSVTTPSTAPARGGSRVCSGVPTVGWDVASWAFGPRRAYRINTSYRRDEGAVVTVSGSVDSSPAAGDLAVALRPFELLGCPVVVDVRHADLGDVAVRVLVEAGLRPGLPGFVLVVVHADDDGRDRIARAGGAALVAHPGTGRSRSGPPVTVGRTTQ